MGQFSSRLGSMTATIAGPPRLSALPKMASLISSVRHVVGSVRNERGGSLIMTPADVESLKQIVDQLHLHHLGMVDPVHPHIRPRTAAPSTVRYLDVCEDPDFHLGVFVLPPGGRIPLHDHPGMCVLSRLLSGTLNVKAYNWCSPPKPMGGLAKVTASTRLTAPCTLALYAGADNVHEFEAGEDGCAILDVLIPPYDPRNGRPCNYYKALKQDDRDGEKRVRLVEIDADEDFDVVSGTYAGPQPETKPSGLRGTTENEPR